MTEEEEKQRIKKENEEHVRRHNEELLPEHPGYVRTTGPCRQSYGTVDEDGMITWTEI